MKKRREQLQINPQKCNGCNECAHACAMKHHGVENPVYSRIKIHRYEDQDFYVPAICMACENAPCTKVCPMNARKILANGSIVTDTQVCIGCKACVYICPVGGPTEHPDTGQTMTCDMCMDEPDGPVCVKACEQEGTLTLRDSELQVMDMARKQAGRLKRMCMR